MTYTIVSWALVVLVLVGLWCAPRPDMARFDPAPPRRFEHRLPGIGE